MVLPFKVTIVNERAVSSPPLTIAIYRIETVTCTGLAISVWSPVQGFKVASSSHAI